MRTRAALLLSALVAAGLAVPAQAADVVYEVHEIPTVGGATLRVEVQRDRSFDAATQPVILTYSPYDTLAEPQPADDAVAQRFVPRGYARAVADVLGTRGSTGCWDYGGTQEQQSGADVVRWLAAQPWSNGRVGMTGVSYEGTTANMVAALGNSISADSPGNAGRGLAGILPVAAISRWYGYAYGDGVRYLGNSGTPTDEGFDTPVGFDLGFGRTVPTDPDRDPEAFAAAAQARAGECGTAEHTLQGYSRTPDYGPFWLARDYRKDAAAFRVPTMVVHGWQDYNVKQQEGTALFEALPVDDPGTPAVEGVPFKKLWMTQSTHANGSGAGYQDAVDAFWAATLKQDPQARAALDALPTVTTRGRSAAGAGDYTTAPAYAATGVQDLVLQLGTDADGAGTLSAAPADAAPVSHLDDAAVTEEVVLRDRGTSPPVVVRGTQPQPRPWLVHASAPLTAPLRLLGSARLTTTVTSTVPGQTLTPLLVEVLPDGTRKLVERGFLGLDYAAGLTKADSTAGTRNATVTFLPQDYTFSPGSRVAVVLMGSNTVWAVPGAAGQLTYDLGREHGTALHLPLAAPLTTPVLPQ